MAMTKCSRRVNPCTRALLPQPVWSEELAHIWKRTIPLRTTGSPQRVEGMCADLSAGTGCVSVSSLNLPCFLFKKRNDDIRFIIGLLLLRVENPT